MNGLLNPRFASRTEEQAFHVEHYLRLWLAYPTADNWARVLGAVRGYAPADDKPGYFIRKHSRIQRLAQRRRGPRGGYYVRTFRKTARAWGQWQSWTWR